MTTENTAQSTAPKRLPLEPLNVKRNEVEVTFSDTEVHRGDSKGWPFLEPKVTMENLDTIITWVGRDNVVGKLGGMLRQLAQGWYEAAEKVATAEDGIINMTKLREAFSELAQAFSARGESIPALKEEIEELTNQMVELDPGNSEDLIKFASFAKQIKALQNAVELKKRDRKPKEGEAAEATN